MRNRYQIPGSLHYGRFAGAGDRKKYRLKRGSGSGRMENGALRPEAIEVGISRLQDTGAFRCRQGIGKLAEGTGADLHPAGENVPFFLVLFLFRLLQFLAQEAGSVAMQFRAVLIDAMFPRHPGAVDIEPGHEAGGIKGLQGKQQEEKYRSRFFHRV